MENRVSVIIPIYKVESFLSRCIDSVLGQTYSILEIILVDDGSPDGCAMICDAYGEKHSTIKVIHKPNGGLASARNAGMRVATGDYVFFVDSDDWIDSNMIAELATIAEREDVDFVRTRMKYSNWPNHPDGTVCDFGIEKMMRTGVYDRERIEKEILPICITTPQVTFGPIVSACGSLYKRKVLAEHNLEFYEDVKYSEDCIFNVRVLMVCGAFYYLNEPQYYNYFYNNMSITKSFRADRWESNKNLIRRFEEDLGEEKRFDIPQQLWRKRLFCILNTLSERHNLKSFAKRVSFCREICSDSITVQAMRHLDGLDVTWKLRVVLWLVKIRLSLVLALIG